MTAKPTRVETTPIAAQGRIPLRRPVFVGGFPGSGTAVVGAGLLGRHHRLGATVPAELGFITEPGGLCDAAAGRPVPKVPRRIRAAAVVRGLGGNDDPFQQRMMGQWYRVSRPGRPAGPSLADAVTRKDLLAALATHRRASTVDPMAAARALAAEVIDPAVTAAGKTRWVDSTPTNSQRLEHLYRVFPDLSFVHVVRDGRTVAVQRLGPDRPAADYEAVMHRWCEELIAARAGLLQIPLGRAITVTPEQLFGPDGTESYNRLLDFLEEYDSPRMRAFWVRQTRRAAFSAQWRLALDPQDLAEIDAAYERVLRRLTAVGIPAPTPS